MIAAATPMTERTGPGWRDVESSVQKPLYGVAQTSRGPYAVGGDGVVVGRGPDGAWDVAVPAGPATKRNVLTAVAATDDRERIWFGGSSGALGTYDVERRRKTDYSAPGGKTSTWEAIAVRGPAGEERLLVANGSGEVLSAEVDERGCPQFGSVVKPGSGSTIAALAFGGETAYAVDTSGNVFARSPSDAADENGTDTDAWRRVGIENAQVDFHDVAADGRRVLVAGDDGLIYRYDRACRNWTPVAVGEETLRGLDLSEGTAVAVGDGGTVVRRTAAAGWRSASPPTEAVLTDVALGSPDAAVGHGGTALERGDGA